MHTSHTSPLALMGLVLALGIRHGVDPDHIAAIDGLSRLRPSSWNGVLFALGHGLMMTLIAVGVGTALVGLLGPFSPWFLLLVGVLNLWRLLRPASPTDFRLVSSSPLLLGIIFAAEFESASQLSALALLPYTSPWVLGGIFTLGMVLVDGADGYLAARIQRSALAGSRRGRLASKVMGVLVVVTSFGLGVGELLGVEFDAVALPLGLALFTAVISIRLWSVQKVSK